MAITWPSHGHHMVITWYSCGAHQVGVPRVKHRRVRWPLGGAPRVLREQTRSVERGCCRRGQIGDARELPAQIVGEGTNRELKQAYHLLIIDHRLQILKRCSRGACPPHDDEC